MSCEFIITLIISIITLVVTGITLSVSIMTYKVNAKSKKITDDMNKRDIDDRAREFISKYNTYDDPQIKLLLACVIANKFNQNHLYNRQLYTEFVNLPNDIQKKILEIQHLNIDYRYDKNFYVNMKQILKHTIKSSYPEEIFNMFDQEINSTTDYLYETYKLNNEIDYNIEKKIVEIFRSKNNIGVQISNMFSKSNGIDSYIITCETAKQIMRFSIKDDTDIYIRSLLSPDYLDYQTSEITCEDLFLFTLATIYLYNNYLNSDLNTEKIEEFLCQK